jgi:uncharacterized membrane protein
MGRAGRRWRSAVMGTVFAVLVTVVLVLLPLFGGGSGAH